MDTLMTAKADTLARRTKAKVTIPELAKVTMLELAKVIMLELAKVTMLELADENQRLYD